MELKIQAWIRLAKKIGENLLNSPDKQVDEEIDRWVNKSAERKKILEELENPLFYTEKAAKRKEIEKRYTWEEFMLWRKRRDRQRKLFIIRYAAAVIVLFGLGTSLWFLGQQKHELQVAFESEIKPGGAKASLILGDGREISLNEQLHLAEADSSVMLSNKNGELSYRNVREASEESCMNTLRVPCGGEYQLILADGTVVRLNSESELVFPARFSSGKREVVLKGEAYFQVAHDSEKPFYVKVHDYAIKVTGTTFNVTSYANDPCTMTTLVEGSVSVSSNDSTWEYDLTPGHILIHNKHTREVISEVCDPRIYTSWIDGEFKFRDMRLEDIMKKLNRWYDFQVKFENDELKDLRFSGAAEKYNPVEFLLRMIESVTKVRFDIERKQIVVRNN